MDDANSWIDKRRKKTDDTILDIYYIQDINSKIK